MQEKNNIKDFIQWYLKGFIILLLLAFIFTGGIYLYMYYETPEEKYYNNYYEINKDKLEKIKDYIINNDLDGYIYIYGTKWLNGPNKDFSSYNGKLGRFCFNNKCPYLINIAKKIDINLISNIFFKDKKNIYKTEGRVITIKPKYKIYKDNENEINYIKGYFKGKKELDKINNNRSHRIVKIFNDDWGVINWDY